MAYVKDEWWHVTEDGKRIGWLWTEDLDSILESYFGRRTWVNEFSHQFGFARSTVDRWRDGSAPIPKYVAHIVNMLSALKNRGAPLDPLTASWLPDVIGANGKLGLPDYEKRIAAERQPRMKRLRDK